jgi:hypothetical protein
VPVTWTHYDGDASGQGWLLDRAREPGVHGHQRLFQLDFVLSGIPYSVSATDTTGLPPEAIQVILELRRATFAKENFSNCSTRRRTRPRC